MQVLFHSYLAAHLFYNHLVLAALGILVKVLDIFQAEGGDIALVRVPAQVQDLFDMLGISSILNTYNTEEEALEMM